MQLLLLVTAVVITMGAALATAAGIMSLMFRLMARGQLAAAEAQIEPQA